jgi:beta-lactamase class D
MGIEQIEFIEKLAKNELPVSKKSQEQAKPVAVKSPIGSAKVK